MTKFKCDGFNAITKGSTSAYGTIDFPDEAAQVFADRLAAKNNCSWATVTESSHNRDNSEINYSVSVVSKDGQIVHSTILTVTVS